SASARAQPAGGVECLNPPPGRSVRFPDLYGRDRDAIRDERREVRFGVALEGVDPVPGDVEAVPGPLERDTGKIDAGLVEEVERSGAAAKLFRSLLPHPGMPGPAIVADPSEDLLDAHSFPQVTGGPFDLFGARIEAPEVT